MKRPAVLLFLVGTIATAVVALLHRFGILLPLETATATALAGPSAIHRLPEAAQYFIIAASAFFVAWLTISATRGKGRTLVLVLAFVAELFALALICGFYQALFQPIPAALAAIVSYLLGWATPSLPTRLPRRAAGGGLGTRLSEEDFERIRRGDLEFNRDPRFADVSALVCDLANKYELADTLDPSVVARANQKFIAHAREILLKAGAYVHATDGEGVVALFGFHDNDKDHANRAISAAFALTRALSIATKSDNGDSPGDVHVGVSSGQMLSSPATEGEDLFLMGEPIELARRFASANRLYGSRILIGPRSFELASDRFVARPIDFLGGMTSHERHEIYEPLAETKEAPKDLVERRDCFWNGVVLYREKRWGEAYAEFQKARGPDEVEDEPLNVYLRRLEPLALHLVDGDN